MRLWLVAALIALLAGLSHAAPGKGTVLVVYKSSEYKTPEVTPAKAHVEPVLKKLGYAVAYHDIDKSLPRSEEMKRYAAVLSWHQTARYARPHDYVRWMRDQVLEGRRVIVLGNFGAHTADEKTWMTDEALNEFFTPFGLEYGAAYTSAADQLEVVSQNKAIVPKPVKPAYYLLFRSKSADNQADLLVKRKDMPNSQSYLVVRTPSGGMVQETYIYEAGPNDSFVWKINPEAFFGQALSPPATSRNLVRGRLLALFKGSEGTTIDNNEIRLFLARPLKELGYVVDYHNIEEGLPKAEDMPRYQGIITWYRGPALPIAAKYANWLTEQIVAGRKVVIFGNYGAYQEELSKDPNAPLDRWLISNEYNNFFHPFGLEFRGAWSKDTNQIREVHRDAAMVPWLEKQHLTHYFLFKPVHPENKVFLQLRRDDVAESDSAVVVRTPYGGLALENYIVRFDGKENRFHVDLKRFLDETLTYKPTAMPKPRSLAVNRRQVPAIKPAGLPQPPPVPADKLLERRVLAFYLRSAKETPMENVIHTQAETILNYLGLVVDYRAIEDGLPSDAEMAPYRGIITWWTHPAIPNAQKYNEWMLRQIQAGKRVAMLGDIGSGADSTFKGQADPGPMLAAMGATYTSSAINPTVPESAGAGLAFTRKGGPMRILKLDPSLCNYERPIQPSDRDLGQIGFPLVKSANPANQVFLTVANDEGESDVVMITPSGGLALGNFPTYVIEEGPVRVESLPTGQQAQMYAQSEESNPPVWRIDPFKFFEAAFQTRDLPKPCVSTLNGSRLYFAHVDGDASAGISLIDKVSLNSEMLYRELFTQTKLPFTVSYVTRDLHFKARPYYARELDAARKILELPHVETASHTENHPFDWVKGDLHLYDGKLQQRPPNLAEELVGSIDFTDQLVAPQGKPTEILLWSGRCNPTEEALAICDSVGVANMNGGDPVYDTQVPYVAGVYPLYSQVGDRIQYHTSSAGDFYYTSSWTKDYDGMKRLPDFFERTDKPYRLRPMNLYFHFYLGERPGGLVGLRAALDYVSKQQIAPIFASQFVPIVSDFITLQLGQEADGSILVHNRGALRTLRFDNTNKHVDLSRSQGVIGYQFYEKNLYVHLDEGNKHRIFLQDQAPSQVYLRSGSHYLNGWKAARDRVTFQLKGTGPGHFAVANLAPSTAYKVSVGKIGPQPITTDASGTLRWKGNLEVYQGVYPVVIAR